MTVTGHRSMLMVMPGLDPVGTGRQIELAAGAFRDAGWDVTIAVGTLGGAVPQRLQAGGFRVQAIGTRPGFDASAAVRLVRLVAGLRPTVIHAWGRAAAGLVGAVQTLALGPRAVAHLATGPRTRLVGHALRRFDRVIAVSDGVAGRCAAVGVPSDRIDVIPPGIVAADPSGIDRAEIARRLGLRIDAQWTLCVAPLAPAARLERLLWAIDQLAVVHREVEHVLVGQGRLFDRVLRRARVQQLADRLRVVSHIGFVPDLVRESGLVWQSGDVAYGGALLDGLAAGVPAVGVAADAARQIIADGETGRIVDADPESEFPRRAFQILEDRDLASRYAAAARRRAAEHFAAGPALARHVEAVEGVVRR